MEAEVSNPETIEMITRGKLTFPSNCIHWKGTEERGWCMGLSQVPVYIRKMPTDEAALQITREVSALKLSGYVHENIVRFISSETADLLTEDDEIQNFTLIATERCLGSVADLFNDSKVFREETIRKMLHPSGKFDPRWILRQATDGLAFLHSIGWIHRNIKPNNFLISLVSEGKYIVKLTDMRHSKFWEDAVHSGTCDPVWKSPEESGQPIDLKMDVFVLGCFYHFVLSQGVHPFGSKFADTNRNILSSRYDVYQDSWKAEKLHKDAEKREAAIDLIKKMIRFDLAERCTISNALSHEYFSPTSDYALYCCENLKPGLCLIINQREFGENRKMRHGTDKDEGELLTTFQQLGFDVIIQRDLTGEELLWCVKQFARSKIWSKYASMALCILSHGNEQVVYGTDKQEVRINKLKYFFNHQDSKSLEGKPKLFIIQACQGGKRMSSSYMYEDETTDEICMEDFSNEPHQTGTEPASLTRKEEKVRKLVNPPIRDTLDILATIPEFVSYRNKRKGSWLIETLCTVLRGVTEKGENVYAIFRKVEKEINKNRIPVWVNIEVVPLLEGAETRQMKQEDTSTGVVKCWTEQKLYRMQTCELRSTLYENLILRKCEKQGQRLEFDVVENYSLLIID